LALELAEPVEPVLPELVPLEPLALPDWAPEAVTGLAVAAPVVPPLPELPDVGAEFTVAGPVEPVDPVLPELPDWAPELESQERAIHGATLTAGPVLPELPELPEFPEVAELPLELAFPVLPELALPDVAVVVLDEEESALPLCPPVAEPLAVLSPELPEVELGCPVAVDEPELSDGSWLWLLWWFELPVS
jgi:homeobox protein ESX1